MIVSLKSEIASAGALAAGCRARWPLAVADSSKGGMVAEAPGSRVFISYRREDSGYPAGWLFDQLAASLGADRVFKDVDSIEPGEDFAEVISDAVSSCAVLAVIGDRWLAAADEDGRRLDDPGDFVRLEIEAALTRGVRVIPVLVGGRGCHACTAPAQPRFPMRPPGDPSQPCPVQVRHRRPAHRAGTGARPGGSPAAGRRLLRRARP